MDPTERKENNVAFLWSYQTPAEIQKKKETQQMNKIKNELFKAIKEQNYQHVMNTIMVESKVGIRVENENEETVFMQAAHYGHMHMFQMLMDLTELIELRQNEIAGRSMTNALLDEMLDRKDRHGRTALHHCLASNSLSVLKILLEVGINIDATDNDGNTVLHLACKRTGSMDFIKLLLRNDIDSKLRNKSGFLAIDLATMASNFSFGQSKTDDYNEMIRLLKTNGAKNNSLKKEMLDDINEIETKAANRLFQIDKKGQNIFHRLSWEGNLKSMKKTLRHIQKIKSEAIGRKMINAKDYAGSTPLHNAIIRNCNAILIYLINQGADVNHQDNIGYTPLMEAVSQNNKYAIDLMLRQGADTDLLDNRNRTARDIAHESKCYYYTNKTSSRRTILDNL